MLKYLDYFKLITAICLLCACSSVKDVKTGKEAFNKKQYDKAIDMLSSEYNGERNDTKRAELAFMLAESYQFTYDYDASVPWYETSLKHFDRPETLLALADAYKKTEQYDAAIKVYTALFNETDEKERFQKEITTCKEVKKWSLEDQAYDYKLLSFPGSSIYNDYGLNLFTNNQVVYVSDKPSDSSEDIYQWTGNNFSSVFISNDNGAFEELFEDVVNSKFNDGPVSFNQDFTELYFTRCEPINLRDQHCRIYYSYWDGREWIEPEPLSFFKESINYGNPVLIDQDSVLIFSANPSSSDHDLYYSVRESYGWSEAFPMPDYINSNGQEMFPTVEKDTLYFSSDGHPGLGGLDVFKTYLRADNSFAPPVNLRKPINSGYDDFYLTISNRSENAYEAYLSTNRGFVGGDDIIQIDAIKKVVEEEPEVDDPIAETSSLKEIFLAIQIYGVDELGNKVKIEDAQLSLNVNGDDQALEGKDGYYIVPVDSLDRVIAVAQGKNHLAKSDRFSVDELIPEGITETIYTINRVIELDPILIGEEIVIDNIYYDFDRWNIREDAKPALNQIVQILLDNPNVKMQLSAHTDCRGDLDFNQDLSQKRAQSAVDYIISTGISQDRLTAVGYGETTPAVVCECDDCTEDNHQTNRRTTFKILE